MSSNLCRQCQEPLDPADAFCGSCGTAVRASAGTEGPVSSPTTTCANCALPVFGDETFCGSCGSRISFAPPGGDGSGTRERLTLHPAAESAACPDCGTPLTSVERFCPHCGRPTALASSAERAEEQARAAWREVAERLRAALEDGYDLERELGRGGMAAVYLAYERALRRRVAVKVISPALLVSPAAIERFNHEAWTMAALEHPNIARIYTVREQPLPFFTMQYVAGRSLDQALKAARRLPLAAVRAILYQVADALAYAHRKGVIHRDIKPSNIMLDEHGRALVMDFGIAKAAEATQSGATGGAIGTVEYMSPEQVLVQPLTGASDQYSLGVVAYQLLSGRVPFEGPTGQVMMAQVHDDPEPLARRLPGCPAGVSAAVGRMLAKDPARRFPDVMAAVRALGAVAIHDGDPTAEYLRALANGDAPAAADLPAAGERRWPGTPRPRALAAAGGGLALLAVLTWLALRPDPIRDSFPGAGGAGTGSQPAGTVGDTLAAPPAPGPAPQPPPPDPARPAPPPASPAVLGTIELQPDRVSIMVGDTVLVTARALGGAGPLRPRWAVRGTALAAVDRLSGNQTGRMRLIATDTGAATLELAAEGYRTASIALRVLARPTPVVVSPPAPEPVAPAPAAALTSDPVPDARSVILTRNQAILDLISARDVDQLGRLYRAEPGTAPDWRDKLMTLIREDLVSATLGPQDVRVDGATATASLQVAVRYQDPVAGGRRNGTLRLLARYSRLGDDWNLLSLSLTQKPPG